MPLLVLLAGLILLMAPAAAEAVPGHTDVMFVFDTSGSMGEALGEAQAEIQAVMSSISASLPNVDYGLAEVRDYGGSSYDEESFDAPWRLDVPLTSDAAATSEAISGLQAEGGGDGPEAYGRALWETDTNPAVGWRPEASHVVVLVADNVPHDNDLNEGIPEAQWLESSPWNTGEELAGTWNIPDTVWSAGQNLDFQSVLAQLKRDGKPLEMVAYHNTGVDYLPYWEHWAGIAGGQATDAGAGELAGKLTTLANEGARLAPNNEFVTLYSHELPRIFRLSTPTPGLFEIPFGAELVPSLSFSARVQPTDPQPGKDEGDGAKFFSFGPDSFSLADFEWHDTASGAPASGSLFNGASLGFAAQLGILGAPTLDDGEKRPLEAAFSVPIASVQATLGPISFASSDVVTPEAQIAAGVDLDVKLYVAQAISYAAEKLAEGAVAALGTLVTDGVDAPLVIDALGTLQEAEIAVTAARYAEMAVKAKRYWNLAVGQAIPIAQLLGQLVSVEAPSLISGIAGKLAEQLKRAIVWVSKGVGHVVSAVYAGGQWVVSVGAKAISGAGSVISKGWHLVGGLFSAKRPLSGPAPFDASPSAPLALARLGSAGGLGFGSKLLTRAAARLAARELVKYGFGNVTVRPLLVSRETFAARAKLCIAGAKLTHAGTAVVELRGPGYQGEALMRTRRNVGGACLRLPVRMHGGRWTVGILDYNAHRSRHGVLLDVFSTRVHERRARRRRR